MSSLNIFSPKRLKEARMSRGMTITELAEKVGVTKQAISQYELGQSSPKAETLMYLVNTLDFPKVYFYGQDEEEATGNTFFRASSRTSQKLKEMQRIRVKWVAKIHSYLEQFIDFPKLNLPDTTRFEDNEWDILTIEELAILTRNYWGLGDKPISNMVNLLEKNGIVVTALEINDNKIDAFCQTREKRTIIILGDDKKSAARRNFDCAHELGHLLMHHHIIDDQEQLSREEFKRMEAQADRFASAFLLPKEAFIKMVVSPKLEHFRDLKKYWKVSMAAMIRRCYDLGYISENQYTYLNKQMAFRKMKKKEPLDDVLKVPSPTLLSRAIELILEHGLKTEEQLIIDLQLSQKDIEMLSTLKPGRLNPKVRNINDQVVTISIKEKD
ncbi:helix-turn-helix domain-containing protein [Ferdinandcohnia sp. SAFN-114]|uniref:helix-turn-helix domain-containing protein n=1 Tax=Ferdinandcohnia sp. SAFN-114 TaxID=3387275 RepID=UPI003F7D5616